jgi:hypothetical protein
MTDIRAKSARPQSLKRLLLLVGFCQLAPQKNPTGAVRVFAYDGKE